MNPARLTATRDFGRKSTDRYLQLPQWGIRSNQYLLLGKNDLKLYLYFISKADRDTRQTPFYSTCDLAERCEMNRKYIRSSILFLAANKLIFPVTRGHRVSVFVIYNPPPGLAIDKLQREERTLGQGKDTPLNSPTLKAKSLNRHSHCETGRELSPIHGYYAPNTEANSSNQCDKTGQAPDWLTKHEPVELGGNYEPGCDTGFV
jgi:hypothetical protein